jgi:hypothetical protein
MCVQRNAEEPAAEIPGEYTSAFAHSRTKLSSGTYRLVQEAGRTLPLDMPTRTQLPVIASVKDKTPCECQDPSVNTRRQR